MVRSQDPKELQTSEGNTDAVASSILASNTGRLVRSTNTPTEI
jgi:hypothetical protein